MRLLGVGSEVFLERYDLVWGIDLVPFAAEFEFDGHLNLLSLRVDISPLRVPVKRKRGGRLRGIDRNAEHARKAAATKATADSSHGQSAAGSE